MFVETEGTELQRSFAVRRRWISVAELLLLLLLLLLLASVSRVAHDWIYSRNEEHSVSRVKHDKSENHERVGAALEAGRNDGHC